MLGLILWLLVLFDAESRRLYRQLAESGEVEIAWGSLVLRTPAFEDSRDSIQRIQARMGKVDEGQLAIAPPAPDSGAVSIAAGEGELSLAKPTLAE
jgi:hypothetical protein